MGEEREMRESHHHPREGARMRCLCKVLGGLDGSSRRLTPPSLTFPPPLRATLRRSKGQVASAHAVAGDPGISQEKRVAGGTICPHRTRPSD